MDKVLDGIKDIAGKVVGYFPFGEERPLSEREYADIYKEEKHSFVDYLPFYDYDPDEQVFLFDDEVSVGCAFELYAFDVDGKSFETYQYLERGIRNCLSAITERDKDPWILQFYLQDEPIHSLVADIKAYAKPEVRNSKLSKEWFEILEEHINDMCRKDGLFLEEATGRRWGGLIRRVRCCLYRRFDRNVYLNSKGDPRPGVTSPAAELKSVRDTFLSRLGATGIKSRTLTQHDMHSWLFPWFSPNPTGFKDAYEYLKKCPYPGDPEHEVEQGAGFDIAETLLTGKPQTDEKGNWYFGDEVSRFIPLQALVSKPKIGLITADQQEGDMVIQAMWNQMPKGSILSMTIIIKSQVDVKRHCHDVVKSGKHGSYEASMASAQADIAQRRTSLDHSIKIFPVSSGVYVRAAGIGALDLAVDDAVTTLSTAGLSPIEPKNDRLAIDQFLYHLPMAYSEYHDVNNSRRSRLTYTDHISRILPLYGRGVGSGNPGNLLFNRIGEPMLFDQFSKADQTKTAHALVFGPTGAGKSATLCFFVLHWAALFGFRFFIIEKGNSFGLITDYAESMGLSTSKIAFKSGKSPVLPPYSETRQALAQFHKQSEGETLDEAHFPDEEDENKESMTQSEFVDVEDTEDEDESEEERDYFGEMELLTYLMITGGEKSEAAKMSRSDKFVIRKSLKAALEKAVADDKPHALPEDVAMELLILSESGADKGTERGARIKEMSDALYLWTSGMHGRIFNSYGKSWKECDITTIDMGDLTNDQNKDMLIVAVISLINTITGIGEKYQFEDRDTVVITDEGHVLTTEALLVAPFVFGVKTWRKLGVWLIQGTQNLDDYPGVAEKMLNLAEWWYLLNLDVKEVEDLAKFKKLTAAEKEMLANTRKEPKRYTEGVVISDKLTSLFRVVMPALPLALAMTDQSEKAMRRKIMKDMNLKTDLEAAIQFSKKIREDRLCM